MTPPDSEILWLALGALFLPFVSFLISFVFPIRYSWLAPIASTLLVLASALASAALFSAIWNDLPLLFHHPWFAVGEYTVDVGIHLDNLSILLMVIVSWVSFLVHLFSIGYMKGESRIRSYFGLLGLFSFSMLGIVMASNLLVAFVAWELVGVSSYLLIGFWRERPSAAFAATKAFVMNRVGDVGLLIGLLLLWVEAGSLDLNGLERHATAIPETTLSLIGMCILIGVVAKSAQFPLSSWLPDAMEGPTPVSALIHAATMVAAGIFLIGRVYFLFTPAVLMTMSIVGLVTALMGALFALHQFDVKKILAYSTISQLGWMVMCLGAGNPSAAEIHLIAHAFFKAGLFLSLGGAIHVLHQASRQNHLEGDIQDIRQLGGLATKMPFVFVVFTACASSLAGLPLFSGFLSKEGMLISIRNPVFQTLSFLILFLTVVYTFRLLWFVFFGQPRLVKSLEAPQIPRVPTVMKIPMAALAIASCWFLISLNPIEFTGWMYSGLPHGTRLHTHLWILLSATVVSAALAFSYFFFRSKVVPSETKRLQFIANNLDLDRWYAKGIVAPTLRLSEATHAIDTKWIDGILHFIAYVQVAMAHLITWFDRVFIDGAANGSANIIHISGLMIRSVVDGKIQSYILWAVAGLTIFMGWILFT